MSCRPAKKTRVMFEYYDRIPEKHLLRFKRRLQELSVQKRGTKEQIQIKEILTRPIIKKKEV